MAATTTVSVSFPRDLLERLDNYRGSLIPRSRLVSLAIEELLDRKGADD
jgi:metal-responsive CopG/Arc/MetJ family transcriptional regulator